LYLTETDAGAGDTNKAVAVLYQSGVVVKNGPQSRSETPANIDDLGRVLYQTSM
jgi:hypothetical protein